MSILDRIQTLLRSEWNARAPGGARETAGIALREARDALVDLRLNERRLNADYQAALDAAQKHEDRAVEHLRRGDEAGARQALLDKYHAERSVQGMRVDVESVRRRIAETEAAVDALSDRLEPRALSARRAPSQWYDRRDTAPSGTASSGSAPQHVPGPGSPSESNGLISPHSSDAQVARAGEAGVAPGPLGAPAPAAPQLAVPPVAETVSLLASVAPAIERMAELESRINAAEADNAASDQLDDLLPRDPLADPRDHEFRELERDERLRELRARRDSPESESRDPLEALRRRMENEK